jgi:type IV pilus assembly protein PilN
MVQINLLPYREQARQVKQVRLGILMACCAGLALVLVVFVHIYFRSIINDQNKINAYLQSQIDQSQIDLTTLKEKKMSQVNLIAQLHYLMNLRVTSYQAVRLMNMLATATPKNVILEKILRGNNEVIIAGQADSDTEVTIFMKNIAAQPGFKQPVLTGITSQQGPTGDERHFQLKVEEQP